jgi:hypothetical protein
MEEVIQKWKRKSEEYLKLGGKNSNSAGAFAPAVEE